MALHEPAVSVVIPVYNAGPYLRECLESAVNQEFRDLEIVCTDDASTDGSLNILREFAAADPRVRIIEKEVNGGAFCARRSGALYSRGRYIMFMDADDRMDPAACGTAYEEISRSEADIFQFTVGVEYCGVPPSGWLERYLSAQNRSLDRRGLQTGLFLDGSIPTALYGKIYDAEKCKEAFRNMPEIYSNMGEDQLMFFGFSCFVDSFRSLPTAPLYWYRTGLGITSGDVVHLDKFGIYCDMSELYGQAMRMAMLQEDRQFAEQCAAALGKRLCEDGARIWWERVPEEEKIDALRLWRTSWEGFPGRDTALKTITGRPAQELYKEYPESRSLLRSALRAVRRLFSQTTQ